MCGLHKLRVLRLQIHIVIIVVLIGAAPVSVGCVGILLIWSRLLRGGAGRLFTIRSAWYFTGLFQFSNLCSS